MGIIRHDVPMAAQGESPVCWLACAAMIYQYKRRLTLPSMAALGQDDFRLTSLMASPDNPAVYAALRRAGFTVARVGRGFGIGGAASGPGMPPERAEATPVSEELIVALLESYGPFILMHRVGMFSYGRPLYAPVPKGTPKRLPTPQSHAVVITGIDTARHAVYFNNPWGDKDVPTTTSSILGAIRQWQAARQIPVAYLP